MRQCTTCFGATGLLRCTISTHTQTVGRASSCASGVTKAMPKYTQRSQTHINSQSSFAKRSTCLAKIHLSCNASTACTIENAAQAVRQCTSCFGTTGLLRCTISTHTQTVGRASSCASGVTKAMPKYTQRSQTHINSQSSFAKRSTCLAKIHLSCNASTACTIENAAQAVRQCTTCFGTTGLLRCTISTHTQTVGRASSCASGVTKAMPKYTQRSQTHINSQSSFAKRSTCLAKIHLSCNASTACTIENAAQAVRQCTSCFGTTGLLRCTISTHTQTVGRASSCASGVTKAMPKYTQRSQTHINSQSSFAKRSTCLAKIHLSCNASTACTIENAAQAVRQCTTCFGTTGLLRCTISTHTQTVGRASNCASGGTVTRAMLKKRLTYLTLC